MNRNRCCDGEKLSNLKSSSSSKTTMKDSTQAVRSIVGDNVRDQNNNAQKMQQIEEQLKKAKERKEMCAEAEAGSRGGRRAVQEEGELLQGEYKTVQEKIKRRNREAGRGAQEAAG